MKTPRLLALLLIVITSPTLLAQAAVDPLKILVDYLSGQRAVMQQVEDQRTDRQVGAAPQAPGSTTLTEKSAIADLLGVAIERGAIAKGTQGSSTTLSTTPYMWLTSFGKDDTPANWERLAWGRRIGISGTFSSKDVTNGDFSSFATGELKWIILGSRSGRDVSRKTLTDAAKELRALVEQDRVTFEQCTVPLGAALEHNGLVTRAFSAIQSPDEDTAFKELDKVFGSEIPADVKDVARRCSSLLGLQAKAREAASGSLNTSVKKALEILNAKQLSFAVLYQRDTAVSDYYTAKILFDAKMPAAMYFEHANLNGVADFNKNHLAHDGTTRLHDVRDWSIEAAANSPKLANGVVDWNLSAKSVRAKDQGSRTVTLAQAKLNLHVTTAATLPIGISWANRETNTVKKGFQINIGFQAVLDQFLTSTGR